MSNRFILRSEDCSMTTIFNPLRKTLIKKISRTKRIYKQSIPVFLYCNFLRRREKLRWFYTLAWKCNYDRPTDWFFDKQTDMKNHREVTDSLRRGERKPFVRRAAPRLAAVLYSGFCSQARNIHLVKMKTLHWQHAKHTPLLYFRFFMMMQWDFMVGASFGEFCNDI